MSTLIVTGAQVDIEDFEIAVNNAAGQRAACDNGFFGHTETGQVIFGQVSDIVGRAVVVVDGHRIDLIGLVQAGGSTKEWQQFWAQHFPDHQIYLAGGGLAILTRGETVISVPG